MRWYQAQYTQCLGPSPLVMELPKGIWQGRQVDGTYVLEFHPSVEEPQVTEETQAAKPKPQTMAQRNEVTWRRKLRKKLKTMKIADADAERIVNESVYRPKNPELQYLNMSSYHYIKSQAEKIGR